MQTEEVVSIATFDTERSRKSFIAVFSSMVPCSSQHGPVGTRLTNFDFVVTKYAND